ncbi:LpqB family beta-propeller domain-containing protein [Microbacterium hominis]|uniref:Uncharacterized protein n=1 Tax=Microbacterium hominis TaxID=162426 RepID=A0A7D4Q1P0_9MICO|nr:LpqB family beta-propeller domain-containing protein [Microbacterium hominis]QKJ19992.1 hypothetical protein HQM25_11915 [Microbacterium hominis]
MPRRLLSAATALVAALALAACAGLPTTGPVTPGLAAGEDLGEPDFAFRPALPQPGATPEQIVDGFIRAGTGATANWARAQEYLAPSFRGTWNPSAQVTIDSGDRTYVATGEGTVVATLQTEAIVDAQGTYAPSDGAASDLTFSLALQDDGEWRITAAPDGIVLAEDVFPSVFHAYAVQYFDPTWTYLVPDLRWFPTNTARVRIVDALADGAPSPWLAESVVNAFPDAVTLDPASVPLSAGVADVSLSAEALTLDQETLDRMQTQLVTSLATAGVSDVEMSVSDTALSASTVATRSTRVAGPPLVLTEAGFGFLVGDDLTPVDGLSPAIADLSPAAVQVAPDRDVAAVRTGDGLVVRVRDDGQVATVDERAGLVDPSVDGTGTVWSVPTGLPSALWAVTPDDTVIDLAGDLPGATGISAIAVSRDGTRLAAAVTVGGRAEVWIAGIVRADGVPERLGEPAVLGELPSAARGLTWIDDATVAVLVAGEAEPTVLEQPVGGPGETSAAPTGSLTLAGGATASNLRVHLDDGALLVQRGVNWTQTATGVLVLATQQGTPQ